MKLLKNRHVLLICLLCLAAGLAERLMLLHYEEWSAEPVILSRFMYIYPVYNEKGSWIYGRMGLDYDRFRLMAEHGFSILIECWLFRFVEAVCRFFNLRRWVLYTLDCGIAALVYRLITRIRGVFTLDYLYIRGRGTFDLPDGYIGIAAAGLIIWLIYMLTAYYPFKKKKVKGMTFWPKLLWEFRFTGMILKATVMNAEKRKELFESWQ